MEFTNIRIRKLGNLALIQLKCECDKHKHIQKEKRKEKNIIKGMARDPAI